MVADAAATGSYSANPFNFQNFVLNYIAPSPNSKLIPRIALEPNFTTNDYLREYLTVMEAMGYYTGPYTWALIKTQWANGHNIWVFKVTPGLIGGLHSKQINGDIRLEMKFATQLARNVTLLVLSEEPATLEIDQFNHVLI